METKICNKCGRELPLIDFPFRDKSKGTRRANCKQCHSNYMKEHYRQNQEKIQELKTQYKCAKCGDNRGYVLDFHHIDPSIKESGISQMLSHNYNLDKIYNEIQKCICLCANCHREFHYLEKNNNITLDEYLSS